MADTTIEQFESEAQDFLEANASKREAEKTADAQEKTISHGNWVDPTESNDLPRLRRHLLLADHAAP